MLDLSFMDIADESGCLVCIDDQIKLKNQKTASETLSPSKYQSEEIKAIRFANNSISSLNIATSPIMQSLNASAIIWLDYSFNQIQSISDSISGIFPNLATLYLHANQITTLSEIKKLAAFPNLKSVSLYGNPVEEKKHYRNMILYICPNLIQLDNSPVTPAQKDKMKTWSTVFRKKLNPDDFDD